MPLIFVIALGLYVSCRCAKQIKNLFKPEHLDDMPRSKQRTLSAISIKAVLVSTFVQAIVWMLSGLLLLGTIILLCMSAHNGLVTTKDVNDMLDHMSSNAAFSIFSILSCVLTPILTGYLGAYIAGRKELLNGFLSQSLSFIFNIFTLLKFSTPDNSLSYVPPVIFTILMIAGPVPGAVGGSVYKFRRKQIARS